ncbi:MAG: hypothetical protein L0H94_11680 [Nitrospira sp.]|nr:hypothetical protein [Nitrospira sp.]
MKTSIDMLERVVSFSLGSGFSEKQEIEKRGKEKGIAYYGQCLLEIQVWKED